MRQSVTHIAGPRITACGRIVQRCCLCGEKLCDSKGVMMPFGPNDEPPEFANWEPGRLVRVTSGNPQAWHLLPDSEQLPDDSCIELLE